MRVTQLLRRYGVVLPELLTRESAGPSWRDAVRVLRRMEARGEIRGGRFVTSFVGEQFALPEAIDLLREVNRSDPTGNMVVVSACDPLNLVGILTTGDRVPAVPGNRIVFRDGVPVASLEAREPVHPVRKRRDNREPGSRTAPTTTAGPGSGLKITQCDLSIHREVAENPAIEFPGRCPSNGCCPNGVRDFCLGKPR